MSYPSSYGDPVPYQSNGQKTGGASAFVTYQTNNPHVVVITQPQVTTAYVQVKDVTFGKHYFWSCMVFWLCGFLFGGIAFILALIGSKQAKDGDAAGARRLAHASLAFIIIGIVIGCAAWSVLIWWLVDCSWTYYGTCVIYY